VELATDQFTDMARGWLDVHSDLDLAMRAMVVPEVACKAAAGEHIGISATVRISRVIGYPAAGTA
jgi:hypothetical protein